MWKSKGFLCAVFFCTASLAAQTVIQAPQSSKAPPAGAASSSAPKADERAKVSAAMEESRQHQDAKALELYDQVLAEDPGNAPVNLLAAGAAIESLQMDRALRYAQRAQQLDPSDWKVHLTLLVADSGVGRLKDRDEERKLVRQFHEDGKYPDAAQSNGFMVEYFPLKDYRVRAIEYFAPIGKERFSYRFLLYGPERAELWAVALESDDLDQASWAQAHKELAAAGQREYSLEGYGTGKHTTYRSYSGKPSYDEVRADAVKVLSEQIQSVPAAPSASK
jgi:hypothetical protein